MPVGKRCGSIRSVFERHWFLDCLILSWKLYISISSQFSFYLRQINPRQLKEISSRLSVCNCLWSLSFTVHVSLPGINVDTAITLYNLIWFSFRAHSYNALVTVPKTSVSSSARNDIWYPKKQSETFSMISWCHTNNNIMWWILDFSSTCCLQESVVISLQKHIPYY
jgi:hypothetical protein